ncbi:carboxypeptidase-like regulatory domain-containing protein [Thalassobellus sediminis]|uniref:carboxypeptidase-like regulatory domain-containing protein n=1 Tax=Thalassobellus sediminis TaxID=3367753 RepID=UPI0037A64CF8
MRKVITIDIPKPCHEDWNTMTPEEKGRHCAVCKKTVYDFTSKTDEQIVQTFTKNGNVCGRFKNTQLKRDLVFSRKEKNNYLSYVASGLFALLGISSQESFAQEKPQTVLVDKTHNHEIQGKIKSTPKVENNLIKGVILDADKIPLPGANIIIKSSKIGTTTDFDGNFSIEAKADDILIISYVGFITKELKLTADFSKPILLELEESYLGGIVVVGGATSCTSTYQLTPEEVLEQKRKREFARKNGAAFYKRQRKIRKQKLKNGEIERTNVGKLFYKITNLFR